MILYHGSNIAIKEPDLTKSKPYKDFGRGFYLSADLQQAKRMAEQRTLLLQTGEPIVSQFSFDESLMNDNIMKVKVFNDYDEEWAEFVLRNRDTNIQHPIHDYDVVYGPIADDGVTFQLRRYKAGSISLVELVQELKYSRGITFQYYFGTPLAISKLISL